MEIRLSLLISIFYLAFSFSQDNVSPKASLSLSDSDNSIGVSNVVTITALFNKAMTATPTLSISGGLLSNVAFTSYTTENSEIGGDIDGEDSGDGFGHSVSASKNGITSAYLRKWFMEVSDSICSYLISSIRHKKGLSRNLI